MCGSASAGNPDAGVLDLELELWAASITRTTTRPPAPVKRIAWRRG